MARSRNEKEPERYYLLPGMGGRSARRKQAYYLKWAIIAAVALSAALAGVMYLLNGFNF